MSLKSVFNSVVPVGSPDGVPPANGITKISYLFSLIKSDWRIAAYIKSSCSWLIYGIYSTAKFSKLVRLYKK